MRARVLPILAYAGAVLTLFIAVLTPFVLMRAFANAVGHAGLHIDATYTGGSVARTIERNGYRIEVYQPVKGHMLERLQPFVQIVFKPADKLPAQVNEEVDLDGDGQPDVRVTFTMPADESAKLHGDVTALNGKYMPFVNVADESFSRMVVQINNEVVVRVPVNRAMAGR